MKPEGRVATLKQQWRYLNFTRNSLYTCPCYFLWKVWWVIGKSFLALPAFA